MRPEHVAIFVAALVALVLDTGNILIDAALMVLVLFAALAAARYLVGEEDVSLTKPKREN